MSDCTPERRWKLFCLRSQTLHSTLLQPESRAVLLPSDRSGLVLGSLFCNWRFCESQTSADLHSSHWLKSPPEGMCLSSLIGRSEVCCTKTVTNIRGKFVRVRVHRAGKHRHEYIKIKHVSKPVMNKCTDLVPLVLWSSAAPEWSVQFGCVGYVHTFTVCVCARVFYSFPFSLIF